MHSPELRDYVVYDTYLILAFIVAYKPRSVKLARKLLFVGLRFFVKCPLPSNITVVKGPRGQVSLRSNVTAVKCHRCQMFLRSNVPVVKYP